MEAAGRRLEVVGAASPVFRAEGAEDFRRRDEDGRRAEDEPRQVWEWDVRTRRLRKRRHALAPPLHEDGAAMRQRGHIAAHLRREGDKLFLGEVQVPEFVESVQDGRRVRRPAAQPCAHGNAFRDRDARAPSASRRAAQDVGGLPGEVLFRRKVARHFDGEVGGGGQLDVVVERNRQHDAAQVVVAVRPRAVYFEREVDLGVGRAAHHRISQRGRSPTIGRA